MAAATAAILGSAAIGAWASNKAAKKQAKASDRAIAAQERLLGPYAQAGQQGLAGVQQFVDQGANYADTQAYKDIVNMAKANGMNLSGNRLTALTDYYATNFRPQRLRELAFLPTLGANAAAGQATNIGNLNMAKGDAQASGIFGMANSLNQGINSLAFLNMYRNQGAQGGGLYDVTTIKK